LARVLDAARRAADVGRAGEDAGGSSSRSEATASEVVWVPWPFLEAEGVQPWTDLPAWLPAPMARLLAADGSKAAGAGLPSRPIEAVVSDIAAWDRARPQEPL